jgi:hypothetical protein
MKKGHEFAEESSRCLNAIGIGSLLLVYVGREIPNVLSPSMQIVLTCLISRKQIYRYVDDFEFLRRSRVL